MGYQEDQKAVATGVTDGPELRNQVLEEVAVGPVPFLAAVGKAGEFRKECRERTQKITKTGDET